ncbi:LytR C-terminal domain-containing protein [Plantactinospora sp. S1510]|uniref:LytR C-terminal domain-containing protein n=1 Tax=Plantactinospora alkalitolerans TaxID=2789879 RepID=A0ABS0GW70_9ACTN|nr:LytR C-terminal domain-containing protein [Plantactinospora alkalitolerans]MBF9130459.1 LytR C-terminal domain-containing protein [Plantactinospora alkalitolerans]
MSFARVRALIVVGVLAAIALVFVAVTLVRDTQAGKDTAEACPPGYKLADARLRLPQDIKINVFNATSTTGLAKDVKEDFQNRKFQVLKAGDEPKNKGVDGVAVLRYGPKGVGSYHVLKAYFLNEATREFDLERDTDVVDVVIGSDFKQLATITEVSQALAQGGGGPQLPPQTCADPKLT